MSKWKLRSDRNNNATERGPALQENEFDQDAYAKIASAAARVGETLASGIKRTKMIITDSNIDPDGTLGSAIAEKYARRNERKRGRPDDPETDIKILNTAARIGRPVSLNRDLHREIAAEQGRDGERRSEATIKTRIRALLDHAKIFRK